MALCFRNKEDDFEILNHQKIVQRYLNIYTPYRGLLLYHGLGSGKTCSSIAILEGMKEQKKIYILSPASLRDNYKNQLSFCGDKIFRLNNRWAFYTYTHPDKAKLSKYVSLIMKYLHMEDTVSYNKIESMIISQKGLWVMIEGDYIPVKSRHKALLQEQIKTLIDIKYKFISYNGINKKVYMKDYRNNGKENPFDNSTIVIDEVHNFVSRIMNNINSKKDEKSASVMMYDDIMMAENCKIVTLTGTPYINHPSELSVLTNLISGAIIVFNITIKETPTSKKINDIFEKIGEVDIVEYSVRTRTISIKRNPYYFRTNGNKIVYESEYNTMTNTTYYKYIMDTLKQNGLTVINTDVKKYNPFPDKKDDFTRFFIDPTKNLIKNKHAFQHRLIGKVSYLGDKISLMPTMIKTPDNQIIHEVLCPMESQQASLYDSIARGKKEQDSQYLIFSRAACNFTFSKGERPTPTIGSNLEAGIAEKIFDEEVDGNDIDYHGRVQTKYLEDVDAFLKTFENRDTLSKYFHNDLHKFVTIDYELPTEASHGLAAFSNKYYKILQNIINEPGCQLFYSNFRKIEGVGMMRLLLRYQGYKELIITPSANGFNVKLEGDYRSDTYTEQGQTKKIFALYTGTEDSESKELIRKIFNSQFNDLPPEVVSALHGIYGKELNNTNGQMVNLLMITASGAEGIDLKNTRVVHIAEPYWHNVRIDQVIGRARRICSHAALPEIQRTVKVYLYMSSYIQTEESSYTKLTIDQKLYHKMRSKKQLADSFLNALKEVAIDCMGSNCARFPPKSDKKIERTLTDIPEVGFRQSSKV